MRKGIMLAGFGVGLGAGLMYAFDPAYGRRRRALLRDKALHVAGVTRVSLVKTARDIGHRARGLAAEAGAHLRREQVSDEKLAARVRSNLGRAVSKPGDIEATVSEGRVTLRGIVHSRDAERLLRRVSKVRGVLGVENQLKLKGAHGEAPAAARENGNGDGEHRGPRRHASGRLLAAAAGSALALYGAKRRGAFGSVMSVVGVRMLRRGLLETGAEPHGGNGHLKA